MRSERALKLSLTSLTMLTALYADNPTGLVGGQDNSGNAYAAFLDSNGALHPISGLPMAGNINAVALNSTGLGVIAGTNGPDPYAAFVTTNGIVAPPLSGFTNGSFKTAGISASGLALVGGNSNGSPYVAQIFPDGTIAEVVTPLAVFNATAINNAGVGLVGGEGGSSNPSALYVFPDGSTTSISSLDLDAGHIYTVSINQSGNGVLGGWDFIGGGPNLTNAFTVTPDGNATPIDLGSISSATFIYTSAINSSGAILLGGQDVSVNSIAAYLVNGTVTPLSITSTPGSINRVVLNDSGLGLIAGELNGAVYAAVMQPDGNLLSLLDPSATGSINDIALNQAGIGLIGGNVDSEPYLALVAPNGALTPLEASEFTVLSGVALGPSTIADQAVPTSAGPYGGAIYSQLNANLALNTRLIQKNRIWTTSSGDSDITQNSIDRFGEDLLAYNEPSFSQNHLALSPKTQSTVKDQAACISQQNSIWLQPFGTYTHLNKQGSNPALSTDTGGVLLGYERDNSDYIIGATLGYAFNSTQYAQSLGSCKLQEEMANVYGAYYADHFWTAAALWGGVYQFHNKRHSFPDVTATGRSHGWILTPHLEVASPWQISCRAYYIEPFVSVDWVNNWQHSYTESGASGLNLTMPHVYDSLLQSEVGLRFYERLVYSWGDLCLEEKLSYMNLAPFGSTSRDVAFVASPSSFPISVGTSKVQNLATIQILGSFMPCNSSYYGGFSFQASAGSSFQSYFGSLFWGVNF